MDIRTVRYQILRRLLNERHLSIRKLAELIERRESQVSSFAGANPAKNIGERLARHIEGALQLPPGYLDDVRHLEGADGHNATIIGTPTRLLPVVGMTTAGNMADCFDEASIEDHIPSPGPCTDRAFVLRLEGVSMLPDFKPGDRLVIDPGVEWLAGDYVFARRLSDRTGGWVGTFKQIVIEEDDYYLHASNPDWNPQYTLVDDTWEIVGKARYQVKML